VKLERFVVLDSWRGIAACLVALYHLEAYSHVFEWPLVRNSYLMVDFFFVLSGFVIAANYQQRLLDGFGLGKFLLLRLGRLYPLHFAMLAVGVALKLLLILIPGSSSAAAAAPFSTPEEAPNTVLANLLLVQGLHVYDFYTWTGQAWSISTELYTYVVFAACLVGLRKRAWIALPLAMIGGPVLIAILSKRNMDTAYDWGIIRCIYGFAAGVVCWNIYERWSPRLEKWLSGSIAEWCTIGLVLAFVCAADATLLSLAAPYMFGLAVLVFAFGAGSASTILRMRLPVFLGTVSYSIYMTHVFIERRIFDAGRLLEKLWHIDPFTQREINGQVRDVLGTELWHGDIAYLVFLALVVAVSYFTYRWIEKPGRDWVRNRVQGRSVPMRPVPIQPVQT